MDKTIQWIRKRGLSAFLNCLAFIIIIGMLLFITSVLWTVIEKSMWKVGLCLTSDCIRSTQDIFSGSIAILELFSRIGTWFATVGGIVVALLNYINSSAATAFGNHVSHSRIFYDYVTSEISKREKIKAVNVDIYVIYALAFDNSRLGVMRVSSKYRTTMADVAHVIESSNSLMMSASADGFRFSDHQHRLIAALSALGIKLTTQPRIDFFQVEEEVFDLLDAINHVFCAEDPVEKLPQRNYR